MSEKDLEALGAMVDIMDSSTRRNVEAFKLCAEVFNRMKEKAKEKPTGRRALVEHTKKKEEDGEE
jgi:hypothetical protein